MNQQVQIIDGDGHIFEDGDGIARHFPFSAARARLRSGVFPLNSHLQYSLTRTPPGAFADYTRRAVQKSRPGGMDRVHGPNRNWSCGSFPTAGQRIGRIVDRDYAVGAARAYNDWLAETYLQQDSRFKGIAIVPMHDADAAVAELHHAYSELGMCGVLFPATGVHLNLAQSLLAGLRRGGSVRLSDRGSWRRTLGPRHGNDERLHRS